MAAAWPSADVDVLADLDEAVGAEDRQPSVAPRRQAIRREPVHADIAGTAIATDGHVAEILEPGILRIVHVADLRRQHLGLRRSGEEQELVRLV